MQIKDEAELHLANALDSLRRTSAISLRVAYLWIPVNFFANFFTDRILYGGTATQWVFLISLQSLLILGYFAGAQIILRLLHYRQLHPLGVITAYVALQLISGNLRFHILREMDVIDPSSFTVQLLRPLPFVLGVLICIAYLLANFDSHRRLVSMLQQAEASLQYLNANLLSQLIEDRKTLQNQVWSDIELHVQEIDRNLASLTSDTGVASTVKSLRDYVENQLKPLSKNLIDDFDPKDSVIPAVLIKPKFFQIPSKIIVADGLHPLTWAIAGSAMALTGAIALIPKPQMLSTTLSTFILTYLLLALISRILQDREFSPVNALYCNLAIFGSLGFIFIGTTSYLISIATGQSTNLVVISTFIGLLIGALNTAMTAFKQSHTEYFASLRSNIDNLGQASSLLRQNRWVTRNRLSHILHGTVQSSLHAASMRLNNSKSINASDVQEIRTMISAAFDKLDFDPQYHQSIESYLGELAEIWKGVCSIHWTVSRSAKLQLQNSEVLSECTFAILQEAVSNACHHGEANEIDIAVTTENNDLKLESTNNGFPWSRNSIRGQGCKIYDELCWDWSVENDGNGTHLRFMLSYT